MSGDDICTLFKVTQNLQVFLILFYLYVPMVENTLVIVCYYENTMKGLQGIHIKVGVVKYVCVCVCVCVSVN